MKEHLLAALAAAALAASPVAQTIVAAALGIAGSTHVIDFGSGVYPNFTTVVTEFEGITISHARYYTTDISNNLVGGFLTSDFSATPNTLVIEFDVPITDLSFVYHQIGTGAPSTISAFLDGVTVASFSGTWNQSQLNNYFGFRNTLFDELQVDFVIDFNIDALAYCEAARWVMHNGTGVNPGDFSSLNRPVLGTNWQGQITTGADTALTILAWSPSGFSAP